MRFCKHNHFQHNHIWFLFTGFLITLFLFIILFGRKILVVFGIHFNTRLNMVIFCTLYIVMGYYMFRGCMKVPNYLYRHSITENRMDSIGIILNIVANIFFIEITDFMIKSINISDMSAIILSVFLTGVGDFYYKRSAMNN